MAEAVSKVAKKTTLPQSTNFSQAKLTGPGFSKHGFGKLPSNDRYATTTVGKKTPKLTPTFMKPNSVQTGLSISEAVAQAAAS